MRFVEEKGEKIIIEEDIRIPGTDIILEKGDVIEVFEAKKKKAEQDDEEEMDDVEEEGEDDDDEEEVVEKKKKKK